MRNSHGAAHVFARTASLLVLAAAALAGCSSGGSPPTVSPAPVSPGTESPGGPECVTSAAKGSCGPYRYPSITHSDGSNTTVGQDVWNPINGWAQTLHATSPGNWHVVANMPTGNTAVVSFPNVGETYSEDKLTSFSSILSAFTEDMNATGATSAWAAYDIWLNNWNNEVMIQHDFANNGPCDAAATATFGGSNGVPVQKWDLCTFGSELVWKLTGGNEQTGSIDILAMLNWLAGHGYLPRASGLTDISYGWEICSTGSQNETFTLSRFTIRAR
jgi:hypothetical protein